MDLIDELGKNFVEQTKYKNLKDSPQANGSPYPSYMQEALDTSLKISLPKPEEIDLRGYDLRKAIEGRTSIRRYSAEELTLEELSYLLWLTQGVKRIIPKNNITMRTVPSAGARHPFETWLSINRVHTVQPGLYHYLPVTNSLEQINTGKSVNEELTTATFDQKQFETGAVNFIWVAHPYRTSWRYSSRAFRYLYLDAGHVCQNLHLAAESIGCGVCAIGAYDDDAVNALIGINGIDQFAIYIASLGKKNNSPEE